MSHKERIVFLLANYYAFVVTGVLVLMTGAIMPYLLQDYNLRYDQGGVLLMLQAVGNLSSGALSGILAAYVGRRNVLILGALCFAAGFGGIALFSVPAGLYLFFFISGLGWGILNNLVNVVVSEFADGDASAINLLHMSFGIGAFLAPFLVAFSISLGFGWRYAVGFFVLMSLLLGIIFYRMNHLETTQSKQEGSVSFSFFRNYRFYFFMLILFFYVGSENSVNGWLTTYLIDTGVSSELAAQRLLSLVWVSVIAGRFLCAVTARYFSKEFMLLAGAAGSALFICVLLFSSSVAMISFAVIGLGLSFAGIYPNTVANASGLIRGSGTASGIMFSCGGLGASVIPYFVGLRAQGGGIRAGMGTVILTLAIMLVLCLLHYSTSRRMVSKDEASIVEPS